MLTSIFQPSEITLILCNPKNNNLSDLKPKKVTRASLSKFFQLPPPPPGLIENVRTFFCDQSGFTKIYHQRDSFKNFCSESFYLLERWLNTAEFTLANLEKSLKVSTVIISIDKCKSVRRC